MEMIYKQ